VVSRNKGTGFEGKRGENRKKITGEKLEILEVIG